jgi:hypothetical protein
MMDQCCICKDIFADELDFIFFPELFDLAEFFLDNVLLCRKKSDFRDLGLNLYNISVGVEFIASNVSASLSGKEQILDFLGGKSHNFSDLFAVFWL